jgi:ribosomal protein S18 acetylase RimI-like enzyme
MLVIGGGLDDDMYDSEGEPDIWRDVPEPQAQASFIVDPPEEDEFHVVAHKTLAGVDVSETIYDIDGVWRVTTLDEDDYPESLQSAVFNVVVDRRYKVEDVRQAVIKLLTNLYAVDSEAE